MAFDEELDQDKREFIFFLYRRFLRFESIIEKLVEQSGEIDQEDQEEIDIYHKIFYQRRKGTTGN